jgi:hypothetical protein
MADKEPKLLWRLKLTYWLLIYGYTSGLLKAWRFSGANCWIDTYYHDGYTAHAAILEDMSYAD